MNCSFHWLLECDSLLELWRFQCVLLAFTLRAYNYRITNENDKNEKKIPKTTLSIDAWSVKRVCEGLKFNMIFAFFNNSQLNQPTFSNVVFIHLRNKSNRSFFHAFSKTSCSAMEWILTWQISHEQFEIYRSYGTTKKIFSRGKLLSKQKCQRKNK